MLKGRNARRARCAYSCAYSPCELASSKEEMHAEKLV